MRSISSEASRQQLVPICGPTSEEGGTVVLPSCCHVPSSVNPVLLDRNPLFLVRELSKFCWKGDEVSAS